MSTFKTTNEKLGHEFEREKGGYIEGLEGEKSRHKCCNYLIISKIK